MDKNQDNIIRVIINVMEDVEKYYQSSDKNKKVVAMNLLKQKIDDDTFKRYEPFIDITIDFIIDVSKNKIKFRLNKKLLCCFPI